jgi:short-subunit dehydrogenase
MFDFKGKTTLITGASLGIGAAFAHELAARKSGLVLVARSEDKLQALAAELEAAHGVAVTIIAADLAEPGAAARLHAETQRRGLRVDVLVNNAGLGMHGPFTDIPIAQMSGQIALNVAALVELTYAYLPEIEAAQGGVIQVASVASFQPIPFMAVYGATKAFVLSFSEALYAEYRGRGVRVLALCPGATETAFFAVAGEAASGGRKKASSADVVRVGLRAFDADRSFVVHGLANYLMTSSVRFFPRALTARVAAKITRPKAALPPTAMLQDSKR